MSSQHVNLWFPTLIWSQHLDAVQNNYLISKALELKKVFTTAKTDWKCNTFNTLDQYDWKNDNDFAVNDLIDQCKTKVHEFSKEYGVDVNIDQVTCKDFWFNIAEPGAYQEYHQHPNSHFSLTYYLSTPENCGNIVFRSFESMFDMHDLPIQEKDLNTASYKTCSYTPQESVLVIFRSNLLHMVEQNLSNQPRISVTMNFDIIR